jgi:ssDNA-binding Zn-finger/Zn-ribbon topoisomerase 1
MGLQCRLLGHAYGNSEIERTREERGDEVVATVREIQTCDRCGSEQVISQNKEVTTVRTPDSIQNESVSSAESPESGPEISSTETTSAEDADNDDSTTADEAESEEQITDEGIILETSPDTTDETQWSESETPDLTTAAEQSAAVERGEQTSSGVVKQKDDAEILDESAGESSREYGAWPQHDSTDEKSESKTASSWPDPQDNGFSATPMNDGAEIAFSNENRQLGQSEQSQNSDTKRAQPDENRDIDSRAPIRAGSDERTADEHLSDDQVELVCPHCEFARRGSISSMRAGDICPKCKRGYITERERVSEQTQ